MRKRSRNQKPLPNPFKRMPLILSLVLIGGIMLVGGGLLYGAHLEDSDSFCASCHTEPETTFYQRTQNKTPVDLATAHAAKGVSCIECHSGAGVPGRVAAMTTVAAADLIAYASGRYHNPAIVTQPIGDDHCLKCHSDITRRRNFENHFHNFLPEWQRLDPKKAASCVSCHQAHPTNGRADIVFLNEDSTVKICQRCHNTVGEG